MLVNTCVQACAREQACTIRFVLTYCTEPVTVWPVALQPERRRASHLFLCEASPAECNALPKIPQGVSPRKSGGKNEKERSGPGREGVTHITHSRSLLTPGLRRMPPVKPVSQLSKSIDFSRTLSPTISPATRARDPLQKETKGALGRGIKTLLRSCPELGPDARSV